MPGCERVKGTTIFKPLYASVPLAISTSFGYRVEDLKFGDPGPHASMHVDNGYGVRRARRDSGMLRVIHASLTPRRCFSRAAAS